MLPVLAETPQWLAINKPAGLLVEHSQWGYPSVEDEVMAYLAEQTRKPFVGIVHRLDRAVSGALLLAKKKQTLKDLNEQFRQHTVKKQYWALVEKAPEEAAATLSGWLWKDQQNKKAILYDHQVSGALACSLAYRTLQVSAAGAWLEIDLHTGKFHQIRVQLAAIGCPIVGDEKYGASKEYLPDAIALHACRLVFTDPITHEKVIITAPKPVHDLWQALTPNP